MKFKNFAEAAIGSKAKLKILLFLLREELPTSEREIAKSIGVSHMSVNRTMQEFYGINLVSPMRIGNVNAWKLNGKSYAYSVLKDLEGLSKGPLDDLKTETAAALGALDVKKAAIFGSIAEGREHPNSDIDLLIIVEDEQKKRHVLKELPKLEEKCLLKYGNRLSPYVLTEAETKKHRQIIESAKKGVAVIG